MQVRKATIEDAPAIAEMGRQFVAVAPYTFALHVEVTAQSLAERIAQVIEDGVGFVAEHDGAICGVILGVLAPLWFCDRIVAVELAWWMDPEQRGGRAALRLHDLFVEWAKGQGVSGVVMSDLLLDERMPSVLERLGYTVMERAHIRGI